MTIHLADGKDTFLNFREKAPRRATATCISTPQGNVVPDRSPYGYMAVGVPGTVMGLETALDEYGTMSREQVMAPAIKLAETASCSRRATSISSTGAAEDFAAAAERRRDLPQRRQALAGRRPAGAERSRRDAGARFRDGGPDAFYKGAIADARGRGQRGQWRHPDRCRISPTTPSPRRAPIRCGYRGYDIISAPPPSSGGTTLCEILQHPRRLSDGQDGLHSADDACI